MSSTTVPAKEGSMTEPEYPRSDATQGPFSFGSSGFCVDGNFRESGTRLRRLLFPELLKSEKARNSAQVAADIVDKSWTKAQLQHYGINFSPDLDPFKAKALLLTSVAHGLCDAVPPQILKIKATLKEEYKSTMEDYRDKMKAYRAQELPKRIQTFEICATPTEKAKHDIPLFLRKYFLDEDGNPDRTKTSDLILLPGYTDRGLALRGRTERIPALHVADGGLGGQSHVTVIGWNRQRVNNKAHDIDMQQTDGRGILRSSHNWDKQMIDHHNFIKKLHNQAVTSDPKARTSFHRYRATGKFVVKSDHIQHGWPVLSYQLSLRFFREGRLAIFDLGIIVGLMVLGKTKVDVMRHVQEKDWDDVSDGEDVSSEEEDNSDESDTKSWDDDGEGEDVSSEEEISSFEPGDPVDRTSDRPVKRQKIDVDHPRRLCFQWRGYNTVSGAIYFDPQNRNTGYLDFDNDDATTFEGEICVDAQSTIAFQGFKVPGLAGPLTMNWNALSHLASERAKAPEYLRY